MYWSSILLLFGCALAADYSGYRLLEVTPKTREDVAILNQVDFPVDLWSLPRAGVKTNIFVAPEYFGRFKSYLYANGMTFHVSDRDINAEIQAEYDGLVARGRFNKVYDINDYNTFDDIMGEVDRLAGVCQNTGLSCSVSTIGESIELRPLRRITVSSGNGNGIIVVDSLIHAREWLAGATVMNILDKLITGYGTDADVDRLLNAYDFVFIPVMNPDGYVYSFTENNRMWRKNRRDNVGSICNGVDLNRNYDFGWGNPGASDSPCQDTYRGASAASEPETQAVQNFILSLSPAPIAALTFHTHGHYLLSPYGDCTYPPSVDDVNDVNTAACSAIEGTFGDNNWQCGNSCEVLYQTSGTTADWYTGGAFIKYAYTPELRNDGFDFRPPASSIAPSVEEIWNGVVAMVDEIIRIEP